jgi:uncharacterized protein YndB with AHSA1/START domain
VRARSHDQGFVAAPPPDVYEILAHPASYARWWPNVAAADGTDPARLRLGGSRVSATPTRQRPGVGIFVELGPPLDGTLEWYLEPFEEGTIVNALLDVELSGSGARRLRRVRAQIRRGLVGLKAALEG